MKETLTISRHPIQNPGIDYLRLAGRLGAADSTEAGAKLVSILEQGPGELHLDLSELNFVDSSGLSVFVALLKRACAREGALVLWDMDPRVLALFELTRLNEIFDIRRSGSQADTRKAG